MFSKRTEWSLEHNPLSIAIDKLKASNTPILDLTESNPTRCGFTYPQDWLSQLSQPQGLMYAPLSKGIDGARRAIQAYYVEHSVDLSVENFVLTSSTSEGYSFLLKLLTNPGDHVLIPKPSYPLFQFLLELHDVTFDYYPLTYVDGQWRIDQKAFLDLMTPRTKAVIVVNPNNPTCSYLSLEDLEFLNGQCQKNKMAIISDEVFVDYPLDSSVAAHSVAGNAKALTFVLSGISKVLGLPQMKLSWIAVNGPKEIVHTALERLEIIADTYLSVNTPVQNALSQWLPQADKVQSQILRRVKDNLRILEAAGFKALNAQGGWYAVVPVLQIHSEEEFILNLLEREHVLVHPGFFFDFEEEGYLVLSLLPNPVDFQKALERISRQIKLL